MKIKLWISAFVLAATVTANGCNGCGPEQHAITTTSPNNFTLGLPAVSRQVQFVNRRLTEPPATHEDFQFIFNTLEGSTNGEGVAVTWSGTDAGTQEIVTLVLALPVMLRDGDGYAIGSTFSVDPGTPSEAGFWGAHDLQDPNKAEVAFVISTYSFPPPVHTEFPSGDDDWNCSCGRPLEGARPAGSGSELHRRYREYEDTDRERAGG